MYPCKLKMVKFLLSILKNIEEVNNMRKNKLILFFVVDWNLKTILIVFSAVIYLQIYPVLEDSYEVPIYLSLLTVLLIGYCF